MNECKFITLDNGLTVLIYSDRSKITNHVELQTFFGGGTEEYCDSQGQNKKIIPGTAHLLEHYLCEHSNNGNLIENLYQNKVMSTNAYTSISATTFYFNTVYNLEECLSTFLNSIYDVSFNSKDISKTKKAIYSEIRDNKDSISHKIYQAKLNVCFGIKESTLGTKTSVKGINSKYLEEVYRNFYVPRNELLVIAGSFDEDKILSLVKKIYSQYHFSNNKRKEAEDSKEEVFTKEKTIIGNDLDEVTLLYKIKTSSMPCSSRYKLDWYLNYFLNINFSRFSSLNEKLNDQNIITGDIESSVLYLRGCAIIEITAFTNHKKKFIREVSSLITKEQDNSLEFELCKKSSLLHFSVRSDKIETFVTPVIDNYVSFEYSHNDTMDFIKSLNYEEYIDTIKSLNFNNYSILTIKKKLEAKHSS